MKKHFLTLTIFCGLAVAGFSQPQYISNLSAALSVTNNDAAYDEEALTDDFARNKGKLPWPVDNGFITVPFGKYTIGDTKLRGNSPGITIASRVKEAPVKAVFDGTISEVDNKGEVTTVFICHGKYYTVYSNLSGIDVQVGDTVKKGQVIGSIGESYASAAAGGELSFIIMSGLMNVNPATWLRH
jgi:murein DD-endopeptidase MepM/ murein hydrolase activator NlpD